MSLSNYSVELLLDFDLEELAIKELLLLGRELLYQQASLKKQSLAKDNLLALTNRVRVKDFMRELVDELKNRYLVAFDSFTVSERLKFSRLITDVVLAVIEEEENLAEEVKLVFE